MVLSAFVTNSPKKDEISIIVGGTFSEAVSITVSRDEGGKVHVRMLNKSGGESYKGVLGRKDKSAKAKKEEMVAS